MEENKISISLLPNEYLKRNYKKLREEIIKASSEEEVKKILERYNEDEEAIFDLDRALDTCGKIGGVCYNKEGYDLLANEPSEKTQRRIEMTINNGHHSIYDHIYINFNIRNLPKILAMTLNNEKQYTTSEKSARYTRVASQSGSSISKEEEELYDKWVDIFAKKIAERYSNNFDSKKINKLAMENARYLVTVFMPTTFIYTTSLRQINNLAAFMKKFIKNHDESNDFDKKLAKSMQDTLEELKRVNVLDNRLMTNNKNREFSLFGKNLDKEDVYFKNSYSTLYKASFAQLAQAQRHRTLDYEMERLQEKEYFIPPIIRYDDKLREEWINDIKSVGHLAPQGELVLVHESGKYKDFILKAKERLCSAAQLEICNQTRDTLELYRMSLERDNNPLKDDIVKYTHGARCTFPDYKCTEDCHFPEGKRLIRSI